MFANLVQYLYNKWAVHSFSLIKLYIERIFKQSDNKHEHHRMFCMAPGWYWDGVGFQHFPNGFSVLVQTTDPFVDCLAWCTIQPGIEYEFIFTNIHWPAGRYSYAAGRTWTVNHQPWIQSAWLRLPVC